MADVTFFIPEDAALAVPRKGISVHPKLSSLYYFPQPRACKLLQNVPISNPLGWDPVQLSNFIPHFIVTSVRSGVSSSVSY